MSLTRIHKDKRARKHLLGLTFLLLIPAIVIGYIALLVGTGAWLFLPVLIPILWWRARQAKNDEPVHIAPREDAPAEKHLSADERRKLRTYFGELAILYAIMVDRAGSERFLKEKELPEGYEVTSRRKHLSLLKKCGLWDRLSANDREAMMMPDGHWDWTRIHQTALGMEPLRLLRWILRLDFYLPLIGQQLNGDFTIAHEIVLHPDKVLHGRHLAEPELVRTGRDSAQHYFIRCLAEGISRGYHTPEDASAVDWARSLSESLSGKQDQDLLLGNHLVSEASPEQLHWATSLAKMRVDFLNHTLGLLESGLPEDFPIASVVLQQV